MMIRLSASRVCLIAGGVLFIAVAAGLMLFSPPSAKLERHVTLVYIGAENCAPCRIWQRGEGVAFYDSIEFARLSYREVKSPTLFDVLSDENWPEDLRAYRQAIGQEAAVPLWLVIADGQMVMQGFGLTQWKEAVLPKVKSLLH